MEYEKNRHHPDRILVVGDAAANLQFLTNLLTAHGYHVDSASDGELTLEFVRSTLPDLILLDIRTPGMDGYEACRRLKSDEMTRSIPVIFLTTLENDRDKVKGFQAGAADYIATPFRAEEVLARVRSQLDLRALTERLEQKVAARTERLATTNRLLRQELAEYQRTATLLCGGEGKYRELIQRIHAAVVVHGADTRILTINARAQQLLGLTEAQMLGKAAIDPDWHFLREDGTTLPIEEYPVNRVMTTGQPLRGLVAGVHRATTTDDAWVLVSADPVMDEQGEVAQVIVTFVDITARRKAQADLHRLNRQLRAISTCNRVLMQASDEEALLADICRIVCEVAGYRMAWVAYPQNDKDRTVRPVAWAGVEEGYLAEADITWDDSERGRGPVGRAIREGGSVCIHDFATDPYAAHWRESALHRGYRSCAALPLKEKGAPPFGAVCIYSTEPNAFTSDEILLLEELADNLAFGIKTLRTRRAHQKAERRLLASEQLFRALVENSPDFIARYDREFRRIYENPAIRKLFSVQAQEVIGKTPADQSSLEAPQIYRDHLRQAIESATETSAEIPFRSARGEMHWGHMRFVPEFGPDGHVDSVLAIGRDIHQIKENEQRFRMLAENFPDFVMRFDRRGRYTYVNPAVEKAFGRPADAIVGKTLHELPHGSAPQQNDTHLKLIHRAFDEGVANASEARWDTEAGERIFEIRHTPEKDAAGNVVSVLGIARDITGRRQMEQERQTTLRFFESMDQINRAIQENGDLEQMMSAVLKVVLAVLNCDRAFLLYPCDPQAQAWKVPMERTKPEYPGVLAMGREMPMDPQVAETFRILLASDEPVKFGPGTRFPLPDDVSEQFGFKSFMSMALHPKTGPAWQFGVHQCAYARHWSVEEERVFREIGRRLEDALTSLLIHRNLQESEQRYRMVFENSPVSILEEDFAAVKRLFDALKTQGVTDIETWFDRHPEAVRQCAASVKIVDVNQATLAMHGAASKAQLFAGLVQTLTQESFDTFRQELVCLWNGETEMAADTVVKTLEGERRDVSVHFSVCTGHEQTLSKVIVSLVNITERKKNEEKMLQSDQRLRLHREQSPLGFLEWDKDFRAVDWNAACERIFGYTREEAIGRHARELILPEEVHELVEEIFQNLMNRRGGQHSINKNVTKDGRVIVCEWFNTTLVNKDDNAIAVASICNDITDQVRAEESIRKLTLAIEQSPVSIVITNIAGTIEFVNSAFTKITGYTAEEVIGCNPRVLKSGETPPEVYRQLWETICSGGVWQGEFRNRKKNGDLFWEQATIAPIRDTENVVTHYVAVKEDITERKKIEEQFRQTQKMEAVGQLAGGVAHDFNNMLGVIIGHAELALANENMEASLRTDLQAILTAGLRSSDIARQLLAFARKQAIEPKILDLNETVEGMLKLLRRLIGEDINLVWLPGSEACHVKMDPSQIDQILANLCVNARDAIAGVGRIAIETQRIDFDNESCSEYDDCSPGPYVVLSVSDNGSGMDKPTMEKIFEPFFTTKGMGRGTGLGLATVYGIVRQNDGFIHVDSRSEEGTTFRIFLPRLAVKTESPIKGSPLAHLPRGDATILLVEDEPTFLELVKKMLERCGYKVLAASTPGEAIRIANENAGEIELLITDLIMPEMTGRDLFKKLSLLLPDLNPLFMSGYSGDIIAQQGGREMEGHFIQKPFSIQDLAVKVSGVLNAGRN